MRLMLVAPIVTIGAILLSTPATLAQANAITRIELQKLEAPDPGHEVKTFLVTIAPHATVDRHIHFGIEMGYLVAGSGTLSIQGQPERSIKAGDSWAIPAGVPHTLHNSNDEPEQLIVTFVVEKGKPLSTAAP